MPGDGIGNDVMEATKSVLDRLEFDAEYVHADIGWEFWCSEGEALPERTIELLENVDASLFGAITSKPKEEAQAELAPELQSKNLTYQSPIVRLRQHFNLATNLRPCKAYPGNPLNYREDIDLVVYRADELKALIGVTPEHLQRLHLVKKYLGSVVPYGDNFYASLNSAVFSDGSFAYIPKGVRCPIELMTYFRINQADSGQFERTLIIAEEGAYVSYLEGCTAPARKTHQLHAAVVELVALDNAEIKYSTLQNWFPGDKEGNGGVYNFVTKRGIARKNAKISWTQVETGSAITWKYPSVILDGDNSVGEFYSVALVNNYQQADTGTKMIHRGKNTKSTIVAKGISAGQGNATYRGLVKVMPSANDSKNFTQCDSLLIGDKCGAHTVPYIEVKNPTAQIEHEASTSKVSDDQLFYCQQRGISAEDAHHMIINGFCRGIFQELPFEFAMEASQLLKVSLEGAVG